MHFLHHKLHEFSYPCHSLVSSFLQPYRPVPPWCVYVNERLSVEERMNKIIPLFSLKKISWPPSLAKINRQKKYVRSNSEVERQFSFMNAYPRHDIVVLGISFFEILLKKISEEWKKSENLYSATSLHIKVERGYANILDNLCVFM